jgi:predicted AlkP superfamily pyrophosphatase or phosphodiesterase
MLVWKNPMKKALVLAVAACCLAAAAPKKPKLIVTIVVDQFRFDYLTRYRNEYKGGLNRLLTQGAVFTEAHYVHVPTITAVGHSTILSGATPSVSGIIGNDWYDREEGAAVTSVSDQTTQLVGGGLVNGAPQTGSSPRRMLVDTLGDEIKMAGGRSRTIGISLKDRSAILPAGRMGDGAYWFDVKSGRVVTSTYYANELPGWVKEFNAPHPADHFQNVIWMGHKLPQDATYYTALESTPFGNELVEEVAERALAGEQLGKHEGTDVLVVSFSSNDYVGHDYGPDSAEAHDTSLRTDALLDKLLQAIDRQAGAANVLYVLTADHGGAPLPETNQARKMPGGRLLAPNIKTVVQDALVKRYGPGEWVKGNWDLEIFLDRDLIASKHLELPAVQHEAARALEAMSHVFRVYTHDDVTHGRVLQDEVSRKVVNGFNLKRSPDVMFIPDPYWVVRLTDKGTSHATPFHYDTHVPIIFMGTGLRPGTYYQQVIVNDIAPTLAAILDIEAPSGSIGRVLSEMFE